MREIPSLQTLCLRNIGGKSCSAEDTFAKGKDGSLSTASRLLRSFHHRKASTVHNNDKLLDNPKEISSIQDIPVPRTPAIGQGSARRKQASDVDLHHPWIAVLPAPPKIKEDEKENTTTINPHATEDPILYAEYNTPALDLLQSFMDSLVELSRMDDARLGLHFFQEWKANVMAKDPTWKSPLEIIDEQQTNKTTEKSETRASKRRRKSNSPTPPTTKKTTSATSTTTDNSSTSSSIPPLSSLSLYNTIIQNETIQAMVESDMAIHLAVLDLTGIQSLQDAFLRDIIVRAPHLQRLSVKNCRRLTHASLECVSEYAPQLVALDCGGSYNLEPSRVLEMVAALPNLMELHASGLLWTDALLADLTSVRSWNALSLGFLIPGHVSPNGLKSALTAQSTSLKQLALPFCEHILDAAMLGVLGRHLPHVECLDVRGNGGLNSLAGWYDGRATIHPPVGPQPLFVLGRYSGISKANVEETKRIHPLQAMDLVCCLESEGVGMGIRRYAKQEQ